MSIITIPEVVTSVCKIIASFSHGSEARVVGGYVRDILSGRKPKEIDIATNILPTNVIEIFSKHSLQTIPTGIKHGTITVVISGIQIEITTLRVDVKCDGRHAEVVFGDSWEEDAKRRDFTINAMYADVNGNVYDYCNGQDDIKNKIVRFIGDPRQRIHEDYLRIMRYFRFLGYFDYSDGLVLDAESFDAAVELSENLKHISAERVRSELMKTLSSPYQRTPINLMLKHGILNRIGFNLQLEAIDSLYFCDDPIINLAALLKAAHITDLSVLKALKFSNNEQQIIYKLLNVEFSEIFDVILQKLLRNKEVFDDVHVVMQDIGKDIYIKLFKMYYVMRIKLFEAPGSTNMLADFLMILNSIMIAPMPVKGDDIMKLGFKNQDIGYQLRVAKNLWLHHKCKIGKHTILRLLNNTL